MAVATHLDQIDAEQSACAWLQAMIPTDRSRVFWQWETFSFAPHDGRVYLLRAHEKPVAAALIVRDGLNRSQELRWLAAAPAQPVEPPLDRSAILDLFDDFADATVDGQFGDEAYAAARQIVALLTDAPAQPDRLPRHADPLTQAIQRLNSSPYSLSKSECIEVLRELRDELAAEPVTSPACCYEAVRAADRDWFGKLEAADAQVASLTTALRDLLAHAKRANDLMLREAGMGVVDVTAIARAEAELEGRTPGTPTIAPTPTPGLLMSMAMRLDHGLGLPGYYDGFPGSSVTHAQRLEGALRSMRQVWEEVAGLGFYSADREAEYAAMVPESFKAGPFVVAKQTPMTAAARDVLAERQRQIGVEGYTAAHDDHEHPGWVLSHAGACYALAASAGYNRAAPPSLWPWEPQAWKPKDPRRNMVRGAALILAAIECWDRIFTPEGRQA